jgi:hypothetical protein
MLPGTSRRGARAGLGVLLWPGVAGERVGLESCDVACVASGRSSHSTNVNAVAGIPAPSALAKNRSCEPSRPSPPFDSMKATASPRPEKQIPATRPPHPAHAHLGLDNLAHERGEALGYYPGFIAIGHRAPTLPVEVVHPGALPAPLLSEPKQRQLWHQPSLLNLHLGLDVVRRRPELHGVGRALPLDPALADADELAPGTRQQALMDRAKRQGDHVHAPMPSRQQLSRPSRLGRTINRTPRASARISDRGSTRSLLLPPCLRASRTASSRRSARTTGARACCSHRDFCFAQGDHRRSPPSRRPAPSGLTRSFPLEISQFSGR